MILVASVAEISCSIKVFTAMEFHQLKRSQFNDIPEFAAKRLPLHPTTRYSNFTETWKSTRNNQYVPRPKRLQSQDDLFPCCLSCSAQESKENVTEFLWHRKAYAGWLQAEWMWDFGFNLDEEWVLLGVGITPPLPPIERDRIFVYTPDLRRGYLANLSRQEHSQLKGDDLHEAKIKIASFFENVNFPGEIIATSTGLILIAVPRTTLLGKGVAIYERYFFENIQMPYNLPILVHGSEIVVENDKVLLNGITLN